MGFFDDDPFEDIIREFFSENRSAQNGKSYRKKFIVGEEESRNVDFIEDEENVYLIFELPGFSSKDVSVTLKGKEIEIFAQKKVHDGVQGYLKEKLNKGISIKKTLPNFVNSKKFDYNINNGVLEIKLGKN